MNYIEIKNKLMSMDTSCLMDADGSLRLLNSTVKPIHVKPIKMAGKAFTVSCFDDFLTVVKALSEAKEGDILVVDGQGGELALAGEIFSTEAKRKGLSGIVIDGAVRDIAGIRALDFPVYARSVNPKAGSTQKLGSINAPVNCGGTTINPGDIVFGDMDGIIVADASSMAKTIAIADIIQNKEDQVLTLINSGRSLFDLLNLEEHTLNIENARESRLKFLLPQ